MRTLTKPVWSEGMYLGPHHFQAQNRYFEDALEFVTTNLWRDASGFSGLQFDRDALRNGSLSLTHARGLFADGLAFDFPGSDLLPAPRDFAALFSPVADNLVMHLAVPAFVRDGLNTNLNGGGPAAARFQASDIRIPDQNTGLDEKLVQIGRKNLQLLAAHEVTDRFVSIPAVRILRDGSGHYEPDPTFIPPSLAISASPALTDMLRRLIDILDEKSTVFTQEQQQRHGVFQAGLSARHVAQFWFLHAINSNVSSLRHFLLSQHIHPQELFREMSRLGGALCTFGLETHPRALPVYNHADLGTCFAQLDDHIRRHLEIVMPSKAIRIPLNPVENFLFTGDIADERCIGPARWILEIQSPIGEGNLITLTPQLTKLCSSRFVVELIKRALPGMAMRHLSVPPPQIAARVEAQYFSIDRAGPCWQHILQTRQVGIYVPAEIPAPTLALIVLLDE
ncbi:type VI secretion system baseplate subunit TssK [Acidicapsa dinghuensis]|uniref:Type VI secretion system baseplate subunit TssK n=1 Tax=Acidicapsa dinghuensis TaxID=2218256 RepID=A0ABW1EG98_9BACT|nr:type VI secretion system baseplate subunit TssK [Acidicapsa dinghuensis]